MPTYLIRWPGLTTSLIRAEDEDHLQLILDEEGDPGGCTWKVYDGPLWVDFHLPVDSEVKERADGRPSTFADIQVKDVAKMVDLDICPMDTVIGGAETGLEMHQEIQEFAFPALAECYTESLEGTGPPPIADEIQEAVKDDLRILLEYLWRDRQLGAQPGDGPKLMRQLGLSVVPSELAEAMSRVEETMGSMGKDVMDAFIEDEYGGELEIMEHVRLIRGC